MRRQVRVGLPQRVMAITGPAVVGGVIDHGGAHGVEFNVALAAKQIGFGLDQRRLVAAIPQGAGASVGGVDVVHVATPEGNDEPGDGLRTHGCDQQVHM